MADSTRRTQNALYAVYSKKHNCLPLFKYDSIMSHKPTRIPFSAMRQWIKKPHLLLPLKITSYCRFHELFCLFQMWNRVERKKRKNCAVFTMDRWPLSVLLKTGRMLFGLILLAVCSSSWGLEGRSLSQKSMFVWFSKRGLNLKFGFIFGE